MECVLVDLLVAEAASVGGCAVTDCKHVRKWESFEKRCRHNFDRASRLCPKCYTAPNPLHVVMVPHPDPVVAVVQVSRTPVGEEFRRIRAKRARTINVRAQTCSVSTD